MENWSCATSGKTSSRRTSTSTRAWAGQGSVGRGSVGRGQGCVSRGTRSGTYRPDCEPAPVEDGGQGRRMYHACLRHPTTTPGVGVGGGVGGATYEHFSFLSFSFCTRVLVCPESRHGSKQAHAFYAITVVRSERERKTRGTSVE